MLPTDRHNFSSIDGLVNRSIDKVRLPSMAWQWEGDWSLDLTLDGQPIDHDGWTYALRFIKFIIFALNLHISAGMLSIFQLNTKLIKNGIHVLDDGSG